MEINNNKVCLGRTRTGTSLPPNNINQQNIDNDKIQLQRFKSNYIRFKVQTQGPLKADKFYIYDIMMGNRSKHEKLNLLLVHFVNQPFCLNHCNLYTTEVNQNKFKKTINGVEIRIKYLNSFEKDTDNYNIMLNTIFNNVEFFMNQEKILRQEPRFKVFGGYKDTITINSSSNELIELRNVLELVVKHDSKTTLECIKNFYEATDKGKPYQFMNNWKINIDRQPITIYGNKLNTFLIEKV